MVVHAAILDNVEVLQVQAKPQLQTMVLCEERLQVLSHRWPQTLEELVDVRYMLVCSVALDEQCTAECASRGASREADRDVA